MLICLLCLKFGWKKFTFRINPHPCTQDAWCVAAQKIDIFSIICFFCCFSLLCEHTAWQQLFPSFALRHADTTLRLARSVWTRGYARGTCITEWRVTVMLWEPRIHCLSLNPSRNPLASARNYQSVRIFCDFQDPTKITPTKFIA